MKKIISIDLDGVLNTYDGNYKENTIAPIREGAKEFLEKLAQKYNIEIYTVRKKSLVIDWLKKNSILDYISEVTNIKNPLSTVFIDDRAVNFDGNFEKTITQINKFKPFWN